MKSKLKKNVKSENKNLIRAMNTNYKKNKQNIEVSTNKDDFLIQKNEIGTRKYTSNTMYRTILTLVMIPTFLFILSLDKLYLFIFIYTLKTLSYREVVRILQVRSKNIKFEKVFVYYFMIVADLYFTGKTLGHIYIDIVPKILVRHHLFCCFSLYIAGFIFFVLSLHKKNLKTQFLQFAVAHVTIFIASIACNLSMQNIVNGKIWFAYPALLVVTNDITAYIFGKLFGKRQLIKLSPKKTWEGFLGGLVCTIIVGLLLCYVKVRCSKQYEILDQNFGKSYSMPYHKFYNILSDQTDSQLLSKQHILNNVYITKIYIHAICFILFASFVAPFGGFFASAFKRAFKVKDFGEAIPGHGGIMDRMDCQFLMGVFTYVYHYTFFTKRLMTKNKIFDLIVSNLSQEDINELINDLKKI